MNRFVANFSFQYLAHASGYVVHIQLIIRQFAAIFLLFFAHIMPSNWLFLFYRRRQVDFLCFVERAICELLKIQMYIFHDIISKIFLCLLRLSLIKFNFDRQFFYDRLTARWLKNFIKVGQHENDTIGWLMDLRWQKIRCRHPKISSHFSSNFIIIEAWVRGNIC